MRFLEDIGKAVLTEAAMTGGKAIGRGAVNSMDYLVQKALGNVRGRTLPYHYSGAGSARTKYYQRNKRRRNNNGGRRQYYARQIGRELKYIDANYAANSIAAAFALHVPATGSLCCPVEGSAESQRTSNRIMITKVQLNFRLIRLLEQDQADAPYPYLVTVAVVLDRQTNGAALTPTTVYKTTDPEMAFRDLEYIRRYKVLWRKTLHMSPRVAFTDGAGTGSVNGDSRFYNVNINLKKPIYVNFIANNGAIGDIADNSLHVIACCSTASQITVQYNSRCRYYG